MVYLDMNMLVLLAEISVVQVVINVIIIYCLVKQDMRIKTLAETIVAMLEGQKA